MKVKDLISHLSNLHPDSEVVVSQLTMEDDNNGTVKEWKIEAVINVFYAIDNQIQASSTAHIRIQE